MNEPQKLAEFLRTRCDKGMYGLRYLDPPEHKIIYIPWPLAPKPHEPLPPEFHMFLVRSLQLVKFKSSTVNIVLYFWNFYLNFLKVYQCFNTNYVKKNSKRLDFSKLSIIVLRNYSTNFYWKLFSHRSGPSFPSREEEVRWARCRNHWPIRSTGSGTPSCEQKDWGRGKIWGGRAEKYSNSPVIW